MLFSSIMQKQIVVALRYTDERSIDKDDAIYSKDEGLFHTLELCFDDGTTLTLRSATEDGSPSIHAEIKSRADRFGSA